MFLPCFPQPYGSFIGNLTQPQFLCVFEGPFKNYSETSQVANALYLLLSLAHLSLIYVGSWVQMKVAIQSVRIVLDN